MKTCKRCGEYYNRNDVIENLEYKGFDASDYEEGLCFDCAYSDLRSYSSDNDDDLPDGCRECGGDYPDCKDSCLMYDN